jgi:hypothetical protein
MSLQSQLESAADALRFAMERQDFSGAAACAGHYGELLRRAIRELPAAEAAQQVGMGVGRLEHARRQTCVARARMGARLRKLIQSARYRPPAAKAEYTWSVQA